MKFEPGQEVMVAPFKDYWTGPYEVAGNFRQSSSYRGERYIEDPKGRFVGYRKAGSQNIKCIACGGSGKIPEIIVPDFPESTGCVTCQGTGMVEDKFSVYYVYNRSSIIVDMATYAVIKKGMDEAKTREKERIEARNKLTDELLERIVQDIVAASHDIENGIPYVGQKTPVDVLAKYISEYGYSSGHGLSILSQAASKHRRNQS